MTALNLRQLATTAAEEAEEMKAMLASYKAQVEQCEKLKVELDLIHNAIDQTKREIAVLHTKSFNGEEMAKVNGELGAVVGGTEEATQQILEAAEAIWDREDLMAKDLRSGKRISEVMGTNYETMLQRKA